MPSPFGNHRNANMYYQHAGMPYHYLVRWNGMPMPPVRAAEANALGESNYIDVVATAKLHKELSGLSNNERNYLLLGGAALAAYFVWKKHRKGRRR